MSKVKTEISNENTKSTQKTLVHGFDDKTLFLTFCERKPLIYTDILRNQFETIKTKVYKALQIPRFIAIKI